MSRNGKIARLPEEIRETLNARLADHEEGAGLLDWLNVLPVVKEVLAANFGGMPISKQNLSEWRLGGFREWQARRDLLEQSRSMAECGDEIENASEQEGLLVDHLASVVAGRMAGLLARWHEAEDPKFEAECHLLCGMSQEIARLQRSMHWAESKTQEWEHHEQDREEKELEKYKEQLISTCFSKHERPLQAELYGGGESGARVAMLIDGIRNARDMAGIRRAVQAAKEHRQTPGQTQSEQPDGNPGASNPVKPSQTKQK